MNAKNDGTNQNAIPESSGARGSDSRSRLAITPQGKAAMEIWDVLQKHEVNYAQALKIFAGLTRQIGRKIEDEEGAAMTLIQNLTKLMPTLLDKVK